MTRQGVALLFPGQGSQYVGMGRGLAEAFPEAAEVFRQADQVLGIPLSDTMWDGPEEELVLTKNAQPAILTHSVAVVRVVRGRLGAVAMAAGHSLGEFSAHVAADTFSFEDALTAVRLRGELMHEAGRVRKGGMAAVLGMDGDGVDALCEEASEPPDSVVVPANYNSAVQIVISGDEDAVDRASSLASERGARRVVRLSVSGAFHSPLMGPAERGLREALGAMAFAAPRFPVYSNVSGEPVTDPGEARELLVRQLTRPVRWAASVAAMVEAGARRFAELGPGAVLTGLNRKNARDAESFAVGEPDDIAALS